MPTKKKRPGPPKLDATLYGVACFKMPTCKDGRHSPFCPSEQLKRMLVRIDRGDEYDLLGAVLAYLLRHSSPGLGVTTTSRIDARTAIKMLAGGQIDAARFERDENLDRTTQEGEGGTVVVTTGAPTFRVELTGRLPGYATEQVKLRDKPEYRKRPSRRSRRA